jgi:altronate dehydratase large subunit
MKIKGYRRPTAGRRPQPRADPAGIPLRQRDARFVKERVRDRLHPEPGRLRPGAQGLAIVLETLSGLAANPNVYGTVSSQRLRDAQIDLVIDWMKRKTNKPYGAW